MNSIVATPADGVSVLMVEPAQLTALEQQVLDAEGRQRVVSASTYATVPMAVRAALCVKHGIYGLVTHELVAWLREAIAGRTAIEIGAGDGVLAQALDIPAIDNRLQEWPDVRTVYQRSLQTPVKYGPNIVCLDGVQALREYRPQVLVASWLTHLYRPAHHEAGGNMYAPDERLLLANCQCLLFIGNSSAHKDNPLLKRRHLHYREPWLYSRAVRGTNFVGWWDGGIKP